MNLWARINHRFFNRHNQSMKRERRYIEDRNHIIYAIGDVHGCYKELLQLENLIIEDSHTHRLPIMVIMIGDYVDRGPDSAKVLDHLTDQAPFERLCLLGNHEFAMCAFLDGELTLDEWLAHGAEQTLNSYGISLNYLISHQKKKGAVRTYVASQIPSSHLNFLKNLPIMLYSDSTIFVHAGIRPEVPFHLQKDIDLISIRNAFSDYRSPLSTRVVHGHTRVEKPVFINGRISIDTGAFKTGILSAVKINQHQVNFMSISLGK